MGSDYSFVDRCHIGNCGRENNGNELRCGVAVLKYKEFVLEQKPAETSPGVPQFDGPAVREVSKF